MIAIYEYKFNVSFRTKVELPIGAEILSVGFQGDDFCFWAKVNTESKTETRVFEVYGTGQGLDLRPGRILEFVGTALSTMGYVVFHVFEVK